MKRYLLTLICMGCCIVKAQTIGTDNYIMLYEKSNTAKYFKMGANSYLDYFVKEKVSIEGNDYFLRIRRYSWGTVDTAYFREDLSNYYHYSQRNKNESVVLPKKIVMGQKWFEADSSWSYQVIGIDEKLSTPAKKYKGLVVIECLQLADKDKDKHKAYHIYYAKDIGMVASVNEGKLSSYLAEIKINAKEGETIGN